MAYRFDPRGDLPAPMVLHGSSTTRSPISGHDRRREQQRRSGADPSECRHTRRPCYDWIFSTSSNVHVAVDKSSFRKYTSFPSYVLTVADQRQVSVQGIGTVDLNIRSQSGSKESHVIMLEKVLHIPTWMCNIFSDIYFQPAATYEHTWADTGVSFLEQEEDGSLTSWGFTEDYLGLEKLVLARDLRGRSPMLEDKDREIFSVNVTWPQGQRSKWEDMCLAEETRRTEEEKQEVIAAAKEQQGIVVLPQDAKRAPADSTPVEQAAQAGSLDLRRDATRSGLAEISANVTLVKGPSTRTSSLKAPTSGLSAAMRRLV